MRTRFTFLASCVLAGTALLSSGGCSGVKTAAVEDELRKELAELDREITELIGAAACAVNEQCRLIALGHKPCGGPAAYRAYSSIGTAVVLLETRVTEYNRLAEQYHRKTNAISDCAILLAPIVQCVEGRCRTTTGESEAGRP
ncbi:MAG: hypothetical protein ABIO65_00100 [Nitrospiria bacterium]